jgi:hypothetical protein
MYCFFHIYMISCLILQRVAMKTQSRNLSWAPIQDIGDDFPHPTTLRSTPLYLFILPRLIHTVDRRAPPPVYVTSFLIRAVRHVRAYIYYVDQTGNLFLCFDKEKGRKLQGVRSLPATFFL